MRDLLSPLLLLQRFFMPALLVLLAWSIWRTLFKKDLAVGLGLYVSLVVLVDGFYNTGLYIPGLEKGSIRYSELCALFLLFQRPAAPQSTPIRRTVLFLVGGYFFLMFIAALRADPPLAGIFDFRRTIAPQILAFALAVRGFSSFEDYRRFMLCVATLALIVSLFSFWDVFFDRWLLHSDMLFKPEYGVNRRQGRFGSVFLNPNFMGAFVVLIFPALFMLALYEKRRMRIYVGIVLLLLLFSLVQTQSRGPLLAFVLSIVLLVLGPAGQISRMRRFGGLMVAVLAFAIFLPGFFERATTRFDTLDKESSELEVSRASMWEYTQRLIGQHPLLGIGLGEKQFLRAMEKTDFRRRYGRGSLDNPHNSYLQAAVYAGLPALACFALANLILLFKAVGISWRGSSSGADSSAVFGLSIGLASLLVCMYPDMHLFTQHVGPLYWLFLSTLLAFVARPPGTQPAPTPAAARAARQRPYGTVAAYGKVPPSSRPTPPPPGGSH